MTQILLSKCLDARLTKARFSNYVAWLVTIMAEVVSVARSSS
jgi:hypothetical protein